MTIVRPRGRASGIQRHDVLAIVALTAVLVVLPFAVETLAGSLAIPANDDWSFRRIATGLAATGRLRLDGIAAMTLVGQVIVVQPLLWLSGLQPSAFVAAGVIFALAATLGSYVLARTVLPPGPAALAAGTLAILPGYLAYDLSFMTDVPALAGELACLGLGALAIRPDGVRTWRLVVSAAVGIVAFSIREFAAVAPAAVLLAALVADRGRPRTWGVAIATAAACAAIYAWRASLPNAGPPLDVGSGGPSQSVRAFSSLALVLAPAALIGAWRWRSQLRRLDLLVGIVVGACLLATPLSHWLAGHGLPLVTLGNPWSQVGSPTTHYLTGTRPFLFSNAVWDAINELAVVATFLVATVSIGIAGAHIRGLGTRLALIAGLGSPIGILLLFAIGMAAGMVIYGLLTATADRYFWPLAVPVAILLLYRTNRPAQQQRRRLSRGVASVFVVAATGYGVILAVVSIVLLLNAAAFNAARWNAGNQLVEMGIPAGRIDAGYEWVGFYASTPANSRRPFYQAWWPGLQACAIVSSQPLTSSSDRLVGTTYYPLRLIAGPDIPLYEYRVARSGCPSG